MLFKRRKRHERELFKVRKKRRRRSHQSRGGLMVRNTEQENGVFKTRMFICIVMTVLMAAVLFANLYYLQIVSYEDYSTRSNENRIRVLPVVPQRGIIYDRNHVVLADNRPVYHLVLFPHKDYSTQETIEKLSELLDLRLSERDIKNMVYLARTRNRFNGVEIAEALSDQQISTFAVNRHHYPNVQIAASLKRFYPFANIATHAIGYVSRINQQDVEQLTEEGKIDNYEGSLAIGKLGIEKYYEDLLHGTTGSREVEVDSHGRVIRTLNYHPPKPGRDLTLTLDIRLQYYAQELLGNMRGAIAAIEPSTGELLAFYSNPSYDPNLFVRGIRSSEYSKLLNHPGRPLINRVTQGGYAPASTVKPLLTIMGLNEGLITTTSTYFGGPAFMLPGSTHRFRDWRSWGHGWLDIYRAIELSADTYFYDLAYRAGIDRIHEYLDLFGFGRSTGVDIHEESLGVNPSRDWKMRRFNERWHLGDTVPIGIGQGYWTTTLLQLVKAHCMVANKGQEVTPHLLKFAQDPLTPDEPPARRMRPEPAPMSAPAQTAASMWSSTRLVTGSVSITDMSSGYATVLRMVRAANDLPRKAEPTRNSAPLTMRTTSESCSGIRCVSTSAIPVDPPSTKPCGTINAVTAKATRRLPSAMAASCLIRELMPTPFMVLVPLGAAYVQVRT